MPMRLPASCVTLSLLLSSLVVSSLESSSLSLSLSLAVLAVLVALVVFVAFAGFAGLAGLVALGVAPFLAGAGAAAAAGVGAGAGGGTISAITFCRRMATTGQSGDLPIVDGTMARSALPLRKASSPALALSVATTCSCNWS